MKRCIRAGDDVHAVSEEDVKMGKMRVAFAPAAALLIAASPAFAQSVSEIVGLDDLIARLGAGTPTGADVLVLNSESDAVLAAFRG